MQVVYEKQFTKVFKKLLPKIQEKFFEHLHAFAVNKYDLILNYHSVEKVYPGCRSIDITGDYRAIFFEDDEMVTFIAIGTHAQLYK